MSTDGQRTKRRRNIAVNFNRLSRVHVAVRWMTTTYSDAKNVFEVVFYALSFGCFCLFDLEGHP